MVSNKCARPIRWPEASIVEAAKLAPKLFPRGPLPRQPPRVLLLHGKIWGGVERFYWIGETDPRLIYFNLPAAAVVAWFFWRANLICNHRLLSQAPVTNLMTGASRTHQSFFSLNETLHQMTETTAKDFLVTPKRRPDCESGDRFYLAEFAGDSNPAWKCQRCSWRKSFKYLGTASNYHQCLHPPSHHHHHHYHPHNHLHHHHPHHPRHCNYQQKKFHLLIIIRQPGQKLSGGGKPSNYLQTSLSHPQSRRIFTNPGWTLIIHDLRNTKLLGVNFRVTILTTVLGEILAKISTPNLVKDSFPQGTRCRSNIV